MIDKLTGLPIVEVREDPIQQLNDAIEAFGEPISLALQLCITMAKGLPLPLAREHQRELALVMWMLAQEAITSEAETRIAAAEANLAVINQWIRDHG